MNKEIKEILDKLSKEENYIQHSYCRLFNYEANTLLDYMTNLQQQLHQASLDIQELTERDIGCPSWCDKLTNLQQENERLKETIDKSLDMLIVVYGGNDEYYVKTIEKARNILQKGSDDNE